MVYKVADTRTETVPSDAGIGKNKKSVRRTFDSCQPPSVVGSDISFIISG